jgi:hypothetical protein
MGGYDAIPVEKCLPAEALRRHGFLPPAYAPQLLVRASAHHLQLSDAIEKRLFNSFDGHAVR